MKTKAYGAFKKLGDNVFRTEACLQLGDCNTPIGMIVLFNPGSSRLANQTEWDRFLTDREGEVSGELVPDPTMLVIDRILKTANPGLQGRLHIYNLFNLREGNIQNAVSTYKTLKLAGNCKNVLETNFNMIDFKLYRWIWLAWSLESNAILNQRKKEIKELFATKWKGTTIAKYKESDPHKIHTYHVRPRLVDAQKMYAQEIVDQMRALSGM